MALSSEQLERAKQAVDERRNTLLADVRAAIAGQEEQQYAEIVGRIPADAGDASVGDMLADLNMSMVERDVRELRELDRARERIREGDYGICEECGLDIPFERLLAAPGARRCVACQAQYEKTHAQPGTPSL